MGFKRPGVRSSPLRPNKKSCIDAGFFLFSFFVCLVIGGKKLAPHIGVCFAIEKMAEKVISGLGRHAVPGGFNHICINLAHR